MMQDSISLKKQILYPSFTTRIFAAFVDSMFLFVLLTPLFKITSNFFYDKEKVRKLLTPTNIENSINFSLEKIIDILIHEGLLFNSLFEFGVIAILLVFFWSFYSTSPGKRLFSIIIVDQDTLKKPSIKQSILRFFSYIISVAPLLLGVFWINFNKKRQAWHDKIARTLVIKK